LAAPWTPYVRICRCISLICLVLFLVLVPSGVRGDETVPLKIILNTEDKGEYLVDLTPEGDILLSGTQFRELGFREVDGKEAMPQESPVSLKSLSPEVTFQINMQEATLLITAAPFLLEKHVISLGYKRPPGVIHKNENSAFLNYAVSYSMGDKFNFRAVSSPSEIGIRIDDYLLYSNFNYTKTDREETFVRLMTNVTRDDPVNIRRYTIGDFFAFSGILGGSGLLGGLSITTNFSLNPYMVRYQGLQVSGLLQTPSEVDLYINNVSIKKEKLPPGEFEFANLYGQTGAGNAALVIRDAFGREETIVTPFYLSSNLLKPGLHDYSYNFGFKRLDFGEESFNYKEPTFIGYHRYGFSETFTGGLSGELDSDIINIGATATFVPWRVGEVDTALAASRANGKYGYGAFLGYTYAGRVMGGNASLRYFSRDYTNLSLKDSGRRPRFEARTGIGFHSRLIGSLSVTAQLLSKYGEEDIKRISVFFNRSLGNNVSMSISASRTDDTRATYDVFAGLVFILGKDHFGTLSMQSQDSRVAISAGIEKNQPRGTGLSYKFLAETKEDDGWKPGGLAYVQYRGPNGIYSAGFRRTSEENAYDLGLSGGLAFVNGSFYLSRPITDSFGLVKVGDVEGVKVLYSNEEVAVTNSRGEAIVPSLLSYNDNKLSIEPTDIPVNYEITELDKYVSPPFRSGSLLTFDVKKIQAFEGRLFLRRKGVNKPAESAVFEVMVKGRAVEAVIGKRGEFYIENLKPGRFPAKVTLGDEECRFEINVPESNEMSVNLGEIVCEMD
jgi:outer membrane usher protein